MKKSFVLGAAAATYLAGAGVTAKVLPHVFSPFEDDRYGPTINADQMDTSVRCYVIKYNGNPAYVSDRDNGFCQTFEGGAEYAAVNGPLNVAQLVGNHLITSLVGAAAAFTLWKLGQREMVKREVRKALAPARRAKPPVDLKHLI